MAILQEAPDSSVTEAIRTFNRFYTDLIGSLRRHYLDSPFTLPEARVVFEIGTQPGTTATQIRTTAHYDQGHLSRILARLERTDVVARTPSAADKRAATLRLTPHGEKLLAALQEKAREQAHAMVAHLDADARARLVDAMATITGTLDPGAADAPLTIREGRPGDLGLLLHRHAVVYRDDFGYDERFEMYVAQGLAPYLQGYDPQRDRLWVAERAGRHAGYIAIHHDDDRSRWAKLRWYLVERTERGRGVGSALLDEAVAFAKAAGYDGIFLWTVSGLDAARRQYERHGFRLVEETEGCPWAEGAREQRWEMAFPVPHPGPL